MKLISLKYENIYASLLITIKAPKRGFYLITDKIIQAIDIGEIKVGMLNLFLKHTSASLTINENFSYDVRIDMEEISSSLVPDSSSYNHALEGEDDMSAHFKSSMFGTSLNIPITEGKLNLGTWQGIYLNEHKNHPTPREIVLTTWGNSIAKR